MYASRSFLYCSCATLKVSIDVDADGDADGDGVGAAKADTQLDEMSAAESAISAYLRLLDMK
jgi:hypothetical protein